AKVALDVALSRLMLADRELRREAAEAVTQALTPGLRTRAFLFNTLLADKATDDRLRRYPHWLASRNLANEASEESVRALIEAVHGRYEIPRRWYRLKARLLGIERLADYDRMAAVGEDAVSFPFARAREIVLGRLLEEDSDPASRLALLAENIESTIATVFRQIAMNRFEHLAHTQRRTQGELSVQRLGELWRESQAEMFGGSVELTDGYSCWWSYIPHFIGS